MFTHRQYREKAAEYTRLLKTTRSPNERREFEELEQRFTVCADNEQWLTDNRVKTVRAVAADIQSL
jgi:hypothetical protein